MSKGEASNSISEEDIVIEIKKNGNNSRNFQCKVAINASFDIIWNLMTDYEKFVDIMRGTTECKLINKKDNTARLCQISEIKLPLGMTKKMTVVMDYSEKNIENSASRKKGDLEFKLVEGDLQILEGKWSIEQVVKSRSEGSETLVGEGFKATLSYAADMKLNSWLPFQLVEGKARRDLKASLSCIREKAEEMTNAQQQLDNNN